MSDIFERSQQHEIFLPESPQGYKSNGFNTTSSSPTRIYLPPNTNNPSENLSDITPETPPVTQSRNERATQILQSWVNEEDQRREFRNQMRSDPGVILSVRETGFLYDMREKGIINDDDIYRIVSAKELGEYLNVDPSFVLNNYDAIWQAVSQDRDDRYIVVSEKTRWEAIDASIQIGKNTTTLSEKGNELRDLNGKIEKANENERAILQQTADSLWKEIQEIRKKNDELGRGFPSDALTTIMTATVQSAERNLKAIGRGLLGGLGGAGVGALAGGLPGAVVGFKTGFALGGFSATAPEMAGLMYVDMLAAGVDQKNAGILSLIGGGLQGLIESIPGLGTVSGVGRNVLKNVGGKIISQQMQRKIAETASKNFITRITQSGAAQTIGKNILTRTLFETARQAGEEGFEEALQYMVEQAMLSVADAMQDSPVDRKDWGSREFMREMEQSVIGGIAGGLGFGIVGLPLNISGNIQETARQTEALRNLAVTINNEAEFRAAAKENSLTKTLTDA